MSNDGPLDRLLAGRSIFKPRPLDAPYPSFIEVPSKPLYSAVTRAYNFVAAALGLLLLSPLLLVVALAVKLTSPGPVFYRGARVGLHQRIFHIYKFRTMRQGAEKAIGARLVRQDENHFTPIGPFLRRYRLDELAQLLNVLKGDMNLVGPRPLRPIFLEEYLRDIPGYAKRFSIRPGITGKAQVRGGYYTAPRHKLRYEMLHIAHRTVLNDLKLIVLTFLRVMTRVFTTGFLMAWIVGAVLLLPRAAKDAVYVRVGPVGFSLLYLTPLLAAGWLFLRREFSDRRIYLLRTPVDLAAGLFVAASLGSVAFSHYPMIAFRGALFHLVTGVLVFYLVLNAALVTTQRAMAARVVAALVTLVAALGLAELAATVVLGPGLVSGGSLYRMRSTLGSTMAVAALLTLFLPLLLALFLRAQSTLWRVAWGLSFLLALSSVLLSFTRSALAGSFLALWMFLRDKHRRVLVAVAAVVLLGSGALSALGDQRFNPGEALQHAGQEAQRQGTLLATFSGKRLLVGVGARALPDYVAAQQNQAVRRRDEASEFRNTYLTLLVEHGLFGFTLFLLIIAGAMQTMRRAIEEGADEESATLLRAVRAGLGGFLLLLLAFDGLRLLPMQVLFWATLGFGVGVALHARPGPLETYRVVHFRERL